MTLPSRKGMVLSEEPIRYDVCEKAAKKVTFT